MVFLEFYFFNIVVQSSLFTSISSLTETCSMSKSFVAEILEGSSKNSLMIISPFITSFEMILKFTALYS